MKEDEVRRLNLLRIIEGRFEGSRADAARHMGVTPGLVSQYLTPGSRRIGERAARNIEKKLSLPYGYLDKDMDDLDPMKDIMDQIRDASPEVLSAIRLLLRK